MHLALRRPVVTSALALLCACGPDLDTPDAVIVDVPQADETETDEAELATLSPSDRIIVWQQNIEAMKAGAAPASRLTARMLAYTYRPDIVILQEAWQNVLCGDYANPAAKGDVELMNWRGSPKDARGLATGCRNGDPLPGSVLARLGRGLWGGVKNVGHRRPWDDKLGSTSRTGTAIAWDERRFVLEDAFKYDDSMVPGCPTTLSDYKRVAVLLRDTRRTADTSDDRLVAVASAHYGSACRASSNEFVAEEMVRRWSTFGARALSLRIIAGDFNTEVDTVSANYPARRRELNPEGWYRDFTENTDWRGGKFVDAVAARNSNSGGDAAKLCGQWTYPNVSSCAAKTACSDTCAGWGIGGKLMRLDYVFVSNGKGTLSPSRIIAAQTDDESASYSDHKAVRVSLSVE
ncbi:MAG: endonuclease/exonuclease/phosphatase family protein [Myxococcota bacterium]